MGTRLKATAVVLAVAAALSGAGGSMAERGVAAVEPSVGENPAVALAGAGGSMVGWDRLAAVPGDHGAAQEGGEASEGGQVVRVAMTADARAPGAALVSMNYELEVATGTGAVPFTLLLFAPATVGELTAQVGGEALALRMTDAAAPRLEGEIELPAALRSTEQLSLALGYRVGDAVREEGAGVRVVLPMLAVDWAPAEARPGMFQAEVMLPEGMEAREIFPVTPSGGATPGVARANLQVLPAVVQVRALPEGSVGLSLPGVLELLVLIVVVACGTAGLRYVRRAR